jgi:hypothetical protein
MERLLVALTFGLGISDEMDEWRTLMHRKAYTATPGHQFR